MAGLVVGNALCQPTFDTRSATSLAQALTMAEAGLSAKDAALFDTLMRHNTPQYADAGRQLGAARQELGRAVNDQPFRQERVQQALTTWKTACNHFVSSFGPTLVSALASISPESRHELVAEHHLTRRGIPGF
jgi:phytoene dehydrogenase-like protein